MSARHRCPRCLEADGLLAGIVLAVANLLGLSAVASATQLEPVAPVAVPALSTDAGPVFTKKDSGLAQPPHPRGAARPA